MAAATMQSSALVTSSARLVSSSAPCPSPSPGAITMSAGIAARSDGFALRLHNRYGTNVGASSSLSSRRNGCWGHDQVLISKTHHKTSNCSTMIVSAEATDGGKSQQIIAITGATGFIGTKLVQRLVADGHTVRVLTRSASKARSIFPGKDFPNVEIAEQPDWEKSIQGTTGVVNLAGTPISGRWTEEIKRDIKNSRLAVTSKVVEAINAIPKDLQPSVFVSATAVGFYGSKLPFAVNIRLFGIHEIVQAGNECLSLLLQYILSLSPVTKIRERRVIFEIFSGTSESSAFDESSPSGKDYLAEVCREWEAKAQTLDKSIRLVRIRIGIVLDKDGGALAQMVPLFQVFAGGPLGSGKQWFSWVHRDDLVSLIMEALANPAYEGVINGTAPNPVRFTELCDRLGAVLGRPSWLPVPEFALKALLGEGASVVLEGQRVLPKRAQKLGFRFKYQYVTDALKAILAS